MSDSKGEVQQPGFSTGALERGNFRKAVSWMQASGIQALELSALRYDELKPLIDGLDELPLESFSYISLHAPSSFPESKENEVVNLLLPVSRRGWNIIVHPNVIYTPKLWAPLGKRLLIENMDRRKPMGRTAEELGKLFNELPDAQLCLDVAHARQLDTSLRLLWEILCSFGDRIREVHISELDSFCRHQPMSNGAVRDYQRVAGCINSNAPVIIESMLGSNRAPLRMEEIALAEEALSPKKDSDLAPLCKASANGAVGHS
jgi:hypothetical protein